MARLCLCPVRSKGGLQIALIGRLDRLTAPACLDQGPSACFLGYQGGTGAALVRTGFAADGRRVGRGPVIAGRWYS